MRLKLRWGDELKKKKSIPFFLLAEFVDRYMMFCIVGMTTIPVDGTDDSGRANERMDESCLTKGMR